MKRIYFLIIVSLIVFVSHCNLFAENDTPYARDEEILQSDELPLAGATDESPVREGSPAKSRACRPIRLCSGSTLSLSKGRGVGITKKEAKKQAALDKKQARLADAAAKRAKIDAKKARAEEKKSKIKEARCEEKKLKAAKVENKRMEKKIAEEKTLEEMRAKKAERAKLEQELEQKRLTDVERRERLYKKMVGIEEERNAEYLKKHGTSLKQETFKQVSLEKNMPENAAELMKKGDDLYNSGNYDSAREHYDKARFLL